MNQYQKTIQKKQLPTKEQLPTYTKAQVIGAYRHIHKSTVGDIWLVESESIKGKFYAVSYIDGEMYCDCPAFTYGLTNPCKHILSIAVKEVATA